MRLWGLDEFGYEWIAFMIAKAWVMLIFVWNCKASVLLQYVL